MQALNNLAERIDNLQLRERGLLMFALIVVLYFVWDMFLMQPLDARQKKVQSSIQFKDAEIAGLNARIQDMLRQNNTDPNEQNRKRLAELKQELALLDEALKQTTAQLVPPQQMARLLELVLRETKGLQLKQVQSLGTEPLVNTQAEEETGDQSEQDVQTASATTGQGAVNAAYRHGLQIEFEGNFFSTLEYLRKLEQLEWKFFWDSIDFKVDEYPGAHTAITVYTISLNRNWIGV